jgi:hypothetical protein
MLPDALAPPEPQQMAQVHLPVVIPLQDVPARPCARYVCHYQVLSPAMLRCRSAWMRRLSSCTPRLRAWCRYGRQAG